MLAVSVAFVWQGTKKGTARGIKLNALHRIIDTRATDGTTLMRFVAELLVDNDSDVRC